MGGRGQPWIRWRAVAAQMLVASLASSGLSGCLQLEPGLSGREAELARSRAADAPFTFVETGPSRAVARAAGELIAIVPVEGLCLTSGAFSSSQSGVFAVVADCLTETAVTVTDDGEGLELPPAFPGLVTVAISGDPATDAEGRGDVVRLRRFLESEQGLALLGRNGSGETVEIVTIEEEDEALLVHVRDSHEGGLALLSPEFWRGFLDIRGRLVLVTVSGFRDRPLPAEEMHTVLRAQLVRIREDNVTPPVLSPGAAADVRLVEAGTGADIGVDLGPDQAAEAEIAEAVAAAEAEGAGASGLADLAEIAASTGPPGPGAPERAPPPIFRSAALAPRPPGDTGSRLAPSTAPIAPSRPSAG